jgi:uncharacterized protein YecT (DUF1311 family)
MARLTPPQKAALRTSERAWLKVTKATCDHAGDDNEGGTLQAIEIDDCYVSQTAKWTDFLVRYKP